MTLDRRNFILLTSAAAAASALPLRGGAQSEYRSENLVLTTGLDTDDSFAKGINANLQAVALTSSEDYAALLQQLKNIDKQRLFALIPPAEALLLEQALRDSNKRRFSSQIVQAPELEESKKLWAFALGNTLAEGRLDLPSHSAHGLSLVAITAYL